MATATISKTKVTRTGGIVILPLKDYEKLLERTVPTYYLTGRAAKKLDALVEEGLREHRSGKTIHAPSLAEAMRLYERKTKGKKH